MKRKQWIVIGILGGIFVALAWAGWFFLVRPVHAQIEAKAVEMAEVAAKLKDAKEKEQQYEKFQAEAENVRRDLLFVASRLDPVLKYSDVFRALDSAGNALNLPKYRFEVGKREKTKAPGLTDMDDVPVTVTFETDYEGLGRFLNAVISQQRLYVPMASIELDFKRIDDSASFKSSLKVKLMVRLFLEAKKA